MSFDDSGRFIIDKYPSQKPFSSFLPGISGVTGIPMWVFYTNRGQAIAGFGVESKDSPIMEFQPANKAYQTTAYTGFRTFLKLGDTYYEPFSPLQQKPYPERDMFIGMNELEIQEVVPEHGIQTNILYFTLSHEPLAGLVRQVTITNTSSEPMSLEILDGMAKVVPYGINDWFTKMMSRTGEAWFEVFNMENDVPFYRTRASIVDKSEVEGVEAGHFYLTFDDGGNILQPIVDPALVFGSNTAMSYPDDFIEQGLFHILSQEQVTVGKTACGFFGKQVTLPAGESFTLYSIIGHVNHVDMLNSEKDRLASADYIAQQHQASQQLTQQLTDTVAVQTGHPTFDAYTRQTFLDNVMRGGWALVLGDKAVYHVYSRKHGDMERDYNAFFLASEPYSQGNGNFRDVNQNRREDVWLNPEVGDFNIRMFANLIQADGYNPLVIHGSKFTLSDDAISSILELVDQPDTLRSFFEQSFTPGKLLEFIDVQKITLKVSQDEFIDTVFQHAEQFTDTSFNEGYWVDHWTYNLDLIETYLGIYPDKEAELLFDNPTYTFHDSDAIVAPRHEKYVLSNGKPRQFNSVKHDEEKIALIASRQTSPNKVRSDNGQGKIYQTTLISKLLSLALVKMATRDPDGMGIEMEADKPGWYDAINGLPGLFGSSMPETFELLRLVKFIKNALSNHSDAQVKLPIELAQLMQVLASDADYWQVTTARETYRDQIRLGFDGAEETFSTSDLVENLNTFITKLEACIQKAIDLNNGIPPTYFRYHPTDYDVLDTTDAQGRPNIRVNAFEVEVLPMFLEGVVRGLKVMDDIDATKAIYDKVRESELYDSKLKMYKLNASLDEQPMDIGRARAFTSGWLENGSIWMHMAYKYLLSILQADLQDEFFTEFKDTLVAFKDPKVYGRSILENSSFIASSAHPDKSIHGQGFVARLSGSTAEFLSILHHMMIGKQPFFIENGELKLSFKPVLPTWLFDEDGNIQFTFLGDCRITYHNPQKHDLQNVTPQKIVLKTNAETVEIASAVIPEPYSKQVRSGDISEIDVYF